MYDYEKTHRLSPMLAVSIELLPYEEENKEMKMRPGLMLRR